MERAVSSRRNPVRLGARLAAVAAAVLVTPLGSSAAGHVESSVPLQKLVGQSIVGGFAGRSPSADFLARIRRGEIGGVILFGGNIGSPAAVRALVERLQNEAKAGGNPPLLVAVDQEGGAVRRLVDGPPESSAAEMGRQGDPSVVRREGVRTGRYLDSLGIGVDLAPVADVANSHRSFLGSRVFGARASRVAPLVGAFVAGLQQEHVAATAKHFPGLGTARANTDLARVVVTTSRVELERRFLPFRVAVGQGVRLVMVSNAAYPALDASGRPAVFSRPIVTGLLRGRLGFGGVVISDALETPSAKAVSDPPAAALAAGVDLLLYTSEQGSSAAFSQLLRAARQRQATQADLEGAHRRIVALKAWLA